MIDIDLNHLTSSITTSSTFPLSVSANSRYLQTAGGTPYLIRGDTPWDLVLLSPTDVATYLDDRVSRGFNTVAWELTIPAGFGGTNYAGHTCFTGNLGTGEDDFATPDSNWWGRVSAVLQACADRNLHQVIFPLYLGYNGGSEGHYADMVANNTASGTKLGTYGAYVGSLLQPFPNVLIALGGDYLPNSTGLGLVKKISDGIKTTDRAGRIYTFHCGPNEQTYDLDTVTAGYRASLNSAWAGSEYSYENWGGGNEFASYNAINNYGSSPTEPFYFFEGHYEYSPTSDGDSKVLRRQSWGVMLGGGCGTHFGQEGVWNFQSGWQSKLSSAATTRETYVHAFFASRAWWLLAPSTGSGLVSSGGGTSNTSGYKARAIASDGSWGAVYVADGSATTIAFSGFNGTKTLKWFDPTTGTVTSTIGTHGNSGTQSYTPSGNNSVGDNDWILVIE